MGVQGLWDLLAPVGRRVSVETLAGKKLAIDASIWMVQFMKAMRDEKGEMVRNAHLLGFFRRICKLLYLKTKPVFVFDGGTPALKRRTVIARRRQRENAQAKIRKTAEKLLLNHLKTMRLKELAQDLENQRQNQKKDSKGKNKMSSQSGIVGGVSERSGDVSTSDGKENLDELLAATIAAEEDERLSKNGKNASSTVAAIPAEQEDTEMILPAMDANVDPAVVAALAPSMQHVLLSQQKNDAKGKKILSEWPDNADMVCRNEGRSNVQSENYNRVKLDEMLAAAIAAEGNESLSNYASGSAASVPLDENQSDEDEEMILPAIHGDIDPAVLAALPPSMQLDLLVQMRERLMAENRQRYQKVKKAPEKFSELQIQAYLKTVAFRREIDDVQKAAAGRGVGGVQTSRIASEANREFIFSSSFTGDKQVLASARVDGNGDKQQTTPSTSVRVDENGDKQKRAPSKHPLDSVNDVASINKSNALNGSEPEESRSVFDGDDVETYLDERGCMRVSRLRAMGIRMTRDLQRNLDMMKEIDHERSNTNKKTDAQNTSASNSFSNKKKFVGSSDDGNGESVNLTEQIKQSMVKNVSAVEISFEDGDKCADNDDEIFARLAANDPEIFSNVGTSSRKQSSDSISDSDWEEGIVEAKGNTFPNNVEVNPPHNIKEGNVSDDSEVEWEEGSNDAPKSCSSIPDESEKIVSRGYLEEEANLQEAIRRSLLDQSGQESNCALLKHEKAKNSGDDAFDGIGFPYEENTKSEPGLFCNNDAEQNESLCEAADETGKSDVAVPNSQELVDSLENELKLSVSPSPDCMRILEDKSVKFAPGDNSEESWQDKNERSCSLENVPCSESVSSLELKAAQSVNRKCLPTRSESDGPSNFDRTVMGDGINNCESELSVSVYHKKSGTEAEPSIEVNVKRNDFVSDRLSHFDKKYSEGRNNNSEFELSTLIDQQKNIIKPNPTDVSDKKNLFEDEPSLGMSKPSKTTVKSSGNIDIDVAQNLAAERPNDNPHSCMEENREKCEVNESVQVEFTEASLEEEMRNLDQESIYLGDEQRKLERNAESVNSEMFAECQELLQMFGLPYIIAPMEAEAQCAYLELANLVDGVVTDDSDVFLFGARSVYKNIFDDRKYVETYFMQDIEKELGLTREKLIRMAMLLGSDYTEGISGIGIVNAIEVVNAFSEEDGLHKFREWIESPDPSILGKLDVKTGSNGKKKGSKANLKGPKRSAEGASEFDQSSLQADDNQQSADHNLNMKQIFMDNHRNVSKNWHIPSSFPREAVISAYSCPQVDKSTEPFSWGKPDIFVLRKMCWERFGWGKEKSDELLLPVLKEYEKRETQLRLEAFYTFNERFAKIRSKRIKKAVKGITGKQSVEMMNDDEQEASGNKKKRRVNCTKSVNNKSEINEAEESIASMQNRSSEMSTSKQSRKRKIPEKLISSQMENLEPSLSADGVQSTKKVSCGKGKGKVQRGGKGRGSRRGRVDAEMSETSMSDDCGGDQGQKVYGDTSEGLQEVRRSKRPRKVVSYDVNNSDTDDMRKVIGNEECSNEEGVELDSSEVDEVHKDISTGLNGTKQQHEAGDALPLEEIHKDYLESGGGFCTEEVETGQPSANQYEDPSLEAAGTYNDYLKRGGGFCLEENETGEDHAASQNPSLVRENADIFSCFGSVDKDEHDTGSAGSVAGHSKTIDGTQYQERSETFDTELSPVYRSTTTSNNNNNIKLDDSLLDDVANHIQKASVGALSAMPFLKRKRRKN